MGVFDKKNFCFPGFMCDAAVDRESNTYFSHTVCESKICLLLLSFILLIFIFIIGGSPGILRW